jgi:Ca-activated chloride channel homolog
MGSMVLGFVLWTAWRTWKRWRAAAYRRAALAEWQQLKTRAADPMQREAALRQLPELIKRTALAAFPRESVASLSGIAWLRFLDHTGHTDAFTAATNSCQNWPTIHRPCLNVLIALTDGNDTGSQVPPVKAVVEYRDGQFKEAAAAFARIGSPEAAFDRVNALLMHGKYGDAIASYDRALQRRPDWHEAKANRDLAEARGKMLEPPKDDAGGTGGQVKADEIVFDDRPKQSGDSKQVEVVTGGQMSDERLQALWLRRVQTKPADFLRAKFAYQLNRRQQGKPRP